MRLIACLVFTVIGILFSFPGIAVAATSNVVITEVRLGGDDIQNGGNVYKQYVVIHNQSGQSIDLANWRLQYAKSDFAGSCTDTAWSTESQLTGTIASNSSVIIQYQLTDAADGSVRILDPNAVVHDMVGWGTSAPCYESQPVAQTPDNSKSMLRYVNCNASYAGVDSNHNANDFISNQASFSMVEAPDCAPECPTGQYLVGDECVIDQCGNISDIQAVVPDGYYKNDEGCFEIVWIKVSELLPNAKGSDTGNEFIELYNPTNDSVDLVDFTLHVGDTITSSYELPDTTILPGSYVTLKDSDIGFSLTNTKSRVVLKIGDIVVDETPRYETAKEDEAWALVNGSWQYTNRPTPSAGNLAMLVDPEEKETVKPGELAPCAANQYRHPETNRCRLVSTEESGLTPCKEGQYRSEETNRCRSVVSGASATLTPCDPGEVRNPETNRCRKEVAASNQLTPCKEGQERNPDTNRCRNVASSTVPEAAFAAEPVPADNKAFIGWWVLGGVAVLAVGRIGWEWRAEIAAFFRRIGTFFTPGK